MILMYVIQNKQAEVEVESKWRPTTSISANKWLDKYSSSSMFSTPTRYHNPIYDPVGFVSGIFARY